MIDDSGSTVIVKFTFNFPAENHVIGSRIQRCAGPSPTFNSSMMPSTAATAQAIISGHAAALRSGLPANKAASSDAASGSARMTRARPSGSDTGGLLLAQDPLRANAGRLQVIVFGFGCCGGQR